jgi:hypothetical protein
MEITKKKKTIRWKNPNKRGKPEKKMTKGNPKQWRKKNTN